jgi:hypothetical protein
MSRGLGRIERAVVAAMRVDPDNALTAGELCEQIYGVPPEKKHRVAVLRAMRSIVGKSIGFGMIGRDRVGTVLYDQASPASRMMAAAKLNTQHLLRRRRWSNDDAGHFEYNGKLHRTRETFSYGQLSSQELERELRNLLLSERLSVS